MKNQQLQIRKKATVACATRAGILVMCVVLVNSLEQTTKFASGEENASGDRTTRETIANSLPYIVDGGEEWMEKRQCVSCHQVAFTLWSLNAAKRHGFDVDADRLAERTEWALNWNHFSKPENREKMDESKAFAANVDTSYQLLLAVDDSSVDGLENSSQGVSWRENYVQKLVDNRQDNMNWKACGQLPTQKRPANETEEATTMWVLYTLAQQNPDDWKMPTLQAKGESSEWWAIRMLLELQLGHREAAMKTLNKLISLQQASGGWGWRVEDDADALATGIVLYAIQQSPKVNRNAIDAATEFLIKTQQDNGSWRVRGTKKNAQKRVTTTASYWGSAWATIALCETLSD